jgi:hypothetical protein
MSSSADHVHKTFCKLVQSSWQTDYWTLQRRKGEGAYTRRLTPGPTFHPEGQKNSKTETPAQGTHDDKRGHTESNSHYWQQNIVIFWPTMTLRLQPTGNHYNESPPNNQSTRIFSTFLEDRKLETKCGDNRQQDHHCRLIRTNIEGFRPMSQGGTHLRCHQW